MFDDVRRYGWVTRLLHWGMALLIFWQFATALSHLLIKDTAVEKFLWNTHKPLGFLLLVLIVLRALWALINLSRRPPSISLSAKLGHLALYLLLFAVPALGLLRQYGSGRAFSAFGIPLFRGFVGKIDWTVELGNRLHGELGWALLVMIAGHIFMAFWHRKQADAINVLPRMWGR